MNESASGTCSPTTFVLVGHCSPDSGMLRSLISSVVSGASIERVNDLAGLDRHAHPRAIWLVNRVLDGSFGDEDGLSLISKHAGGPILLLVSNFADAQEEAIRRGAVPGFGKRALYAESTKAALAAAVERSRALAT